MPILDLDSHRLHYLDEGRGLPVLLFHAYPLSAELFRPQIEALKDRFRFLVPDMRGFGQSGPADGPTTMRRMAQDGLALLDALGIERAVVGGVSMGGYVSMALLREDASRVLGLVLSSTQARADTEEARQGREAIAAQVEQEGVQPVIDAMVPKLVNVERSGCGPTVTTLIQAATPAGIAGAQRGMAQRLDSREVLARFAGPALVLVGREDAITPVDKAEAMHALLSNGELTLIEDAQHLPNLEQPGAFNAALATFLERVDSAG
ncbi:MAG TPA: alpha/beta fold hydrolase [Myxococcaceae bacterium]|nr:alpha/beta fold hydrolase [Myxococcaceae bacterium]